MWDIVTWKTGQWAPWWLFCSAMGEIHDGFKGCVWPWSLRSMQWEELACQHSARYLSLDTGWAGGDKAMKILKHTWPPVFHLQELACSVSAWLSHGRGGVSLVSVINLSWSTYIFFPTGHCAGILTPRKFLISLSMSRWGLLQSSIRAGCTLPSVHKRELVACKKGSLLWCSWTLGTVRRWNQSGQETGPSVSDGSSVSWLTWCSLDSCDLWKLG